MNTDPDVEQIFAAFAELREVRGDGPRTRKLLDALFRSVHNLKAKASANGLTELAAAAHEFENVLHSLRTGHSAERADAVLADVIPTGIWNSLKQDEKHTLKQSIAEGARLFLVQTDFDVADFDRQFQNLKETLSNTGEVISTSPKIDNERPGKVNFRVLYARAAEAGQRLPEEFSDVTIEEISLPPATTSSNELTTDTAALERCFERFSAAIVDVRAIPLENLLEQVLRAGRAAARTTGKEVDLEVRGEEVFDKTLAETIANPLIHLIRNAVDHGIESSEERSKLGKPARGKIVIEATQFARQTIITVTDDGRGIDPTLIANGLLFRPGFSTTSEVSELSGRGVGLDVVQTAVKQLGGSVRVTSKPGEGSTFEITIPVPSP